MRRLLGGLFEDKGKKLFHELKVLSITTGENELRNRLSKYLSSKWYIEYVLRVVNLISKEYGEEYMECIHKYRYCGAAAVITCAFYLVSKHQKEIGEKLQAVAAMLKEEFEAEVEGKPRKALSEAKKLARAEKDKKVLAKMFQWFDKEC